MDTANTRAQKAWGTQPPLDAFSAYLGRRRMSPHTIRLKLSYTRRLLADYDPLTVTEYQIEEWIDAHQWSDESTNTAISSIRSFFGWMLASGAREDNPAAELVPVKVAQRRARIADDSQILAALEAADPETRAMILLGAECGLRRHEIAKVHTDDIDGDFLYVVGKGNKQRVVHMPPELIKLIPSLGSGYWFPGRHGGHIHDGTVYDRVKRYVHVNPHALRHRAGTTVYRGTGNDIRVAQEFLGHSTPQMTARYVHVTRDDLRRASAAASLYKAA